MAASVALAYTNYQNRPTSRSVAALLTDYHKGQTSGDDMPMKDAVTIFKTKRIRC